MRPERRIFSRAAASAGLFARVGAAVLVGAALTAASFCASAADAASDDAATLYRDHCAVCHGDQGDGMTRVRRGLNPPPRNFTTPVAKEELTRERMIASVKHGRSGTAMMGFASRMSESQIASVVDYIRDKFMLKEAVRVDDTMRARAAGELIYVSNCSVCHGDDGNGAMWTKNSLNPPPRDFTATSPDELTRERMITSVTHGRPGTAMMSFAHRLSPQDVEHVVDYVRTSFLGRSMMASAAQAHGGSAAVAAPPIVPADMSVAMPKQLVGDAAWGRDFYMKNCFTCHGEKGNGEGPRAAFNQPRPRNFLADDSRQTLNRPALFKAISMGKNGTVMPAWSKVLNEQEIANVAEFVFQTFVHPQASVSDDKKKAPG